MKLLAPVGLFVYRRPEATARALDSLRACPESRGTDLVVYSDGPRTASDRDGVFATRDLISRIEGFKSVTVVAADDNHGLSTSIMAGVTQLCDDRGAAIIVEDDLLVSSSFLEYMNAGLSKYASERRVGAIAGHSFPLRPLPSGAFFLGASTTWGWATWKRAWDAFEVEPDVGALAERTVRHAFDLHGVYPYSSMLLKQSRGELDSWGIRWWWTIFRRNWVSLFPPRSLVRNEGFSVRATNTLSRPSNLRRADTWRADLRAPSLPELVAVNHELEVRWHEVVRLPRWKMALIEARTARQVKGRSEA